MLEARDAYEYGVHDGPFRQYLSPCVSSDYSNMLLDPCGPTCLSLSWHAIELTYAASVPGDVSSHDRAVCDNTRAYVIKTTPESSYFVVIASNVVDLDCSCRVPPKHLHDRPKNHMDAGKLPSSSPVVVSAYLYTHQV